jgi:two-component system sensor histidine kinase TctE
MSLVTDSPSIRRRLLLFLLPPLVLLMLIGALANYRVAMLFVRGADDERLAESARALAMRVGGADQAINAGVPPVYFLVTGAGGRWLAGNSRLPVAPPSRTNPSFADVQLDGRALRVATFRIAAPAGTVEASVAEPTESRAGASHFILTSAWLIDFIQVDVTLLLVWFAVHYGLKPLLTVRRQIEARSARDLQPLVATAVPVEVRPLVEALNLLFEMLSEAARSQRQFVADTAHQLRTPIAGLLGNLELLMAEQPAASTLRTRLAALHEGMTRLAHSANQLLALARADRSGSLAEPFEVVELHTLVARAVERSIDRAGASGLDLGADARPAAVSGSARLLEDLIGNLLDNALNYTPAGGHVTVRSGVADGQAFLEVEDDGPGIPPGERARVRQRFYRLPGTPGKGCGLGLAIVEENARLHGATFTLADGAQGRGTKVRVLFAAGAALHQMASDPLKETANNVSF